MIELKSLTREEKILISVQCERFFLTVNKYKNTIPVFNTIKESLGLPDRFDKELWCVLTCVGKSLRSGNTGSQFSLKSTHYTAANEEHNLKLNKNRASEVLRNLDEKGWITHYKGYFRNADDRMRGCIIFTNKLTSLFSPQLIARYAREITHTELVEVKDSKTKLTIMKCTKFKGISRNRNFMFNYNSVLNLFTITMCGVKCAVNYKQVFADSLDGAGRLYTFGGFQTARSELRKLIRIGEEEVTEVDVRGIHPSICRLVQGCPAASASFDPYGIPKQAGITCSPDEFRGLCKSAIMCMINCVRRIGAAEALYNVWALDKSIREEDQDFPSILDFDKNMADTLIRCLENHNAPIKFFGKESLTWKQLQRYDSRVCEGVVARFVKAGIPVLCWHDSWVCAVKHRGFLIHSIKESWFEVFNTKDNCFLKVEF